MAPDWSLAKAVASDQLISGWQRSPLIQDPNSLDLAAAVMEGPCIPFLVGVEVGADGTLDPDKQGSAKKLQVTMLQWLLLLLSWRLALAPVSDPQRA